MVNCELEFTYGTLFALQSKTANKVHSRKQKQSYTRIIKLITDSYKTILWSNTQKRIMVLEILVVSDTLFVDNMLVHINSNSSMRKPLEVASKLSTQDRRIWTKMFIISYGAPFDALYKCGGGWILNLVGFTQTNSS